MRRTHPCKLLVSVLFVSALLGYSTGRGLAQSPSTCHWRQHAVAITPDPPGDTANARGQIVDSLIGLPAGVKIGSPEAANMGISVVTHPRSMEELPRTSDGVVAATFTTYETHETPSGRSLYTLAKLQIDNLVSDRTGRLSVGESLPVLLLGGSAVLPSGSAVSYGIPQIGDSIVPGHRYLAFLHFNQRGEFFEIEKTWDVSTGKAIPNSAEDKERARSGHSFVMGSEAQVLIENLKSELATR